MLNENKKGEIIMDILTIENNNIKITSLLLTRFITNDNYNNN